MKPRLKRWRFVALFEQNWTGRGSMLKQNYLTEF